MQLERIAPSGYTYAAWILSGVALVLVLLLQLLPALVAGMVVYELVHVLAPLVSTRLSDKRAKIVAVALLSVAVVGLTAGAIAGAVVFFRSDAGSLSVLLTKMAEIVAGSRGTLPDWLVNEMPENPDDMRDATAEWFRAHATEVQTMGKEVGRVLVHALIGMIIGALVALHESLPIEPRGPLSVELIQRVDNLGDAFRRVVFAQVRISLLNTLFTAVYLTLVLPLFGVDLPLRKTLIAVTFLAGLLPVIGNLISNAIIVIVSLSHSFVVALVSLAFLIVIHKLEYFLNARIIGRHVHARAWELLLAMLVMEAAFGLAGVVAAPIYYAFVKDELSSRGLL